MLFDFEVSNILGLFMGVVTMKLGYFDWWGDQKMLKISQFAPLYPTVCYLILKFAISWVYIHGSSCHETGLL